MKNIFKILFIVYILGVSYISFTPLILLDSIQSSVDLIPFKWVYYYTSIIDNNLISQTIVSILGKFILLLPAGFFIPFIWGKIENYKTAIIYGFLISLLKEVIQLLLTSKNFTTDDLILNTAGFILGFYIYKIYTKKSNNKNT